MLPNPEKSIDTAKASSDSVGLSQLHPAQPVLLAAFLLQFCMSGTVFQRKPSLQTATTYPVYGASCTPCAISCPPRDESWEGRGRTQAMQLGQKQDSGVLTPGRVL